MIRKLTGAFVAAALLVGLAAPAAAEESRYEPGNVWYVSDIDVLDGQFENYMTWLANEWVKFRKLNAQYGNEVGYYVLANTQARNGEPDLYLVTINKDFQTIAEGLATEKKINEAMAKDRKQFEKEGAERAPMRKTMGSIELIELKLK
ncbi:MAG: hypothetical protein HW378_4920 [Anaerolineales bacterium]|jgi:hypothetical protein|nr:hypothetical protein [Anaerolineales bacterium]